MGHEVTWDMDITWVDAYMEFGGARGEEGKGCKIRRYRWI